MDQDYRSGFVAVVGRPNVGKSTLINRIMGDQLSVVTPKAQTTRHAINAIYTTELFQMILVDTPGIHESKTPLNSAMTGTAEKRLEDSDAALFITTPNAKIPAEDLRIIDITKTSKSKAALVINKIDLIKPGALLPIMESYSKTHEFEFIFPISATKGAGIDDLIKSVASLLPHGAPLFPEDDISDLPVRFFVEEMIREQLIMKTGEEIPYKTAVSVESFQDKGGIVVIKADIHCEKSSQKKIIIGKKGQLIKQIGIRSREKIEAFLEKRVHLELFVKVSPGWTKKENMLREFGYIIK